jgi:hypothetical protein
MRNTLIVALVWVRVAVMPLSEMLHFRVSSKVLTSRPY